MDCHRFNIRILKMRHKKGPSLQKRSFPILKIFTKREEEGSVEEDQTTDEFDSQANVWNGEKRVIEIDILI